MASFRASSQDAKIPLYHIIGRWLGEGSDTDCVDKGYILIKPDHFTKERFFDFLQQAIQTYDQYSFVFKSPGEHLTCVDREGSVIQAYSGDISIDLLAKVYSTRLSLKKRFSFIGLEISNGSIMSFRLFKGSGVEYYLPEGFFERKKVK